MKLFKLGLGKVTILSNNRERITCDRDVDPSVTEQLAYVKEHGDDGYEDYPCLLYTSPSPRDS